MSFLFKPLPFKTLRLEFFASEKQAVSKGVGWILQILHDAKYPKCCEVWYHGILRLSPKP